MESQTQNITEKQDRKLASIEIIENIRPIDGADTIEVCSVKGWDIVIKKNEFKEGDKCIYVEIDSVLPDLSCFEFLKDRGFRVKTIKLRGQISQGICFPLSQGFLSNFRYALVNIEDQLYLREIIDYNYYSDNAYPVEIGADLTQLMGITKYIPKSAIFFNNMQAKGSFPTHLFNKTDEERMQNILGIIKHNLDVQCIHTEKLNSNS